MSKMKKILALAMAVAMMIGMTITASAAEAGFSATIKVNGIAEYTEPEDAPTITYAQVVKPDRTSKSGWAVVEGCEGLFKNFTGDTIEERLATYMAMKEDNQESARLEGLGDIPVTVETGNPISVSEPGLYLIAITQNGYDYSTMLAYVSYDDNGKQVAVDAKKTPKQVVKTVAENETQVEINDELHYTINATIPYIPVGSDKKFEITDELTGATFKLNADGKAEIQVSGENAPRQVTPVTDGDKQVLKIDLTDLTAGNSRANTPISLTYTVIVTGTVVDNTAYPGDYKQNAIPVKSYTAKITIIKKNEATATTEELLDGAEFVIKNADGKFAQLDSNNLLTAWVDTEAEATKLVTGAGGVTGKITAYGFDADLTYKVVETKAPEGYALDSDPVTVSTWVADTEVGGEAKMAEITVHDSKLAQLPHTGGSGTAAFTGFGVLLMSIAAGLYFSTKKNSAK